MENKDLAPCNSEVCDSTPHPQAGGALPHLDSGGGGGDQPQYSPNKNSHLPPDFSKKKSPDSAAIHVLATYATHEDLLAAMTRTVSWVRLDPEAAHRALLPNLTHLVIDGQLKRLDALTPDQLRTFIRDLVDRREFILDQAAATLGHPAQPPHGVPPTGEHP